MGFELEQKTFEEIEELHGKDEGIVLLGAGGDLNEWIEGVGGILKDEGIALEGPSNFGPFYELKTLPDGTPDSGDRTDLVMLFNEAVPGLEVGKLAMWRLAFGDCSWLSDYFVNYANQHGLEKRS